MTVKVNIVLIVMGRMDSGPILPVKVVVTMGIMLNFDSDCDGDVHKVGTYKYTLIFTTKWK